MKIAILTQPLTNNYGGILQNFALQEVLRSKGHDVVTLNVRRPIDKLKITPHWFLSIFKRFVQKYVLCDPQIIFVNAYKQVNFGNTPQRFQQRFLNEHIKVDMVGPEALTQDNDQYEAYVVGSDQVWRPCFSTGIPNYYLDFVKNSTARRVAYAASFGVDYWETDIATTAAVVPLAQKFNGVSVREQSAIKLCKEHLGIDAVHVLDPTMLLSSNDYRRVYNQHLAFNTDEQYIATYVLDRDPKVQSVIQSASRQLGLPVKQLGTFSKDGFDSIESWLQGIDKATYVITDSFHGSIFSLIFGKQFVALGNRSRGMTRFKGLFAQFEINDRLVTTHDEVIVSLLRKINYDRVHDIIAKKQIFAHQFLDENLGGYKLK